MKKFMGAMALLMVAACQTNVGQGPLLLTGAAKDGFDHYMNNRDDVSYFAVAVDGHSSFNYIYCPDQGCAGLDKSRTIQACEKYSNGVPCKIYAFRKEVIWQFDEAQSGGTKESKKAKPSELTFFWTGAMKAAYVGELTSGPNPESYDHVDFKLSEYGSENVEACDGKIVHPYAKHPTVLLECEGGVTATAVLQKPVNTSDFQIKGTGISNGGRRFTFYINHDYY